MDAPREPLAAVAASPAGDDRPGDAGTARAGLGYALLAYGAWGFLPIFWKLFQRAGVPAPEVLAHRMLWSIPVVVGLLAAQGRLGELAAEFRRPGRLPALAATALLLAANWGLYIYGVTTDRIVETSLGYFINPLLNVALGALFLREALTPRQWGAVALAGLGVVSLVAGLGAWPWIALSVAVTFSAYGLVRKVAPAAPLTGLSVETILLAPFAFAFLAWWNARGWGSFGGGGGLDLLFALTGAATSLPLLWFAHAAKRLRYATLGLVQYIAPTLQFSLGVFAFGEPFTRAHAFAFALIWAALALYTAESLRLERRLRRAMA